MRAPRLRIVIASVIAAQSLIVLFATFGSQERSDRSPGLLHPLRLLDQQNDGFADVIHLAFVCAKYNSSRDVVTLVKSILFYRKNPLHFHFITDYIAHHILDTVFSTWMVPAVQVSFYPADEFQANVSWIQNRHHSGAYGLMKMIIQNILPSTVTKVIILDAEVMFATDIGELWQLFRLFSDNQIIGLVENQNDWYREKSTDHRPWPAVGRGFNTGVMLLDLVRHRLIDWVHTWQPVAYRVLATQQFTDYGDQDIINAAILANPSLVYRLPCEWNVQLLSENMSTECYTNERNIKAVLWNTSAELKDKVKQTDYFFKLYLKFLSYDGSLFRSDFYSRNKAATGFMADTGKTDEQSSDDDSCFEYDREQRLLHRTHPYYFEYNNSSVSATDVSLVTQLSADRLQLLDQLCDYWPGPISLALYMTDEELYEFLLYTMQTPVLASRRNIAYHIVYKDGKFYPVNYLRNVALRRVSTQYVFLLDIDFVPMPNIYSYLRLLLQTASSIASKLDIAEPSKMGIIVPAFESEQYKMRFPSTKQRVISMLDSGSLFTFKHNTFPEAQAATNYTKWRTSSEPYKVSWAPYFEPYVIVPRNIPEFNERFFGWGWNKALHMMELDAAGFTFVVSPDAFVIHRPHERSSSRLRIILTRTYRQCSNILKTDFYHYLTRKYGSRAQKYACVLNRTIEQWC